MKDNNRLFFVINEEGIKQDAEILAKFKLSNNQDYITYTFGEINDNDMVKIYSTGVTGEIGNYSYKTIDTTTEWDEIKEILKTLAKEEVKELDAKNKSNLKILNQEISVRNPKKLLVSNKFAKEVGSKYKEEDEVPVLSKPEVREDLKPFTIPIIDTPKKEEVLTEPLVKSLTEEKPVIKEEKISIPSFEELQAKTKKVDEVMGSVKEPEIIKPTKVVKNDNVQKEDYTAKFKSEVEPVLLDVYSKQQAQIDALEEELSKTKYDLFEEQKLSLSLKTANKELTEKGNKLENELNDARSKVDGIMSLLQGNK